MKHSTNNLPELTLELVEMVRMNCSFEEENYKLDDLLQRCQSLAEKYLSEKKKDSSLTTAKQEIAKRELRHAMADLSENHYCAGWLINLEFELWAMTEDGIPFGHMKEMEANHMGNYLKELAETANGWWVWDSKLKTQKFVSLEKWKILYTIHEENKK